MNEPAVEKRQVKRRLKRLTHGSYIVACVVSLLALHVAMLAIRCIELCELPGVWLWGVLVFFALLGGVFYLTLFALRPLWLRLRWMTPDEAQHFPLRRTSQWPDAWLETSTDDEEIWLFFYSCLRFPGALGRKTAMF